MPIRNFADVQAFEVEPLARRALPRSTFDALAASAKRWPDTKALSFFLTADTYEHALTWTYADLLADVTRAANLLHKLGVDADHPVAFVLPNLPKRILRSGAVRQSGSCSQSIRCSSLCRSASSCERPMRGCERLSHPHPGLIYGQDWSRSFPIYPT